VQPSRTPPKRPRSRERLMPVCASLPGSTHLPAATERNEVKRGECRVWRWLGLSILTWTSGQFCASPQQPSPPTSCRWLFVTQAPSGNSATVMP